MTDSLENLLRTADAFLQFGEVDDALAALDEAAHAAPDDPLPYLRRAEVLASAGRDLRQALADLDRAAALGMDTVRLHFRRMIVLAELGEVAAARAAHAEALRLEADNPRLWDWGVRLALLAGDLAGALALVRTVREKQPGAFGWARREATLLLQTGDWATARDAFTALIEAGAPADPIPGAWEASQWVEIYLARAEAHRHLANFDAALADLACAEKHLPDDPGIPFGRGLVAWARGDADGAFPLLRAGLESAGPGVREEFWRALVDYPRRGDLRAALESASRKA